MDKESRKLLVKGLVVLGAAVTFGAAIGYVIGSASGNANATSYYKSTLMVQKYAESLGGSREGFHAFYAS